MGAREQRNRGYSRGVRGTLGEKGLRGSDQYFSGRRGAFEGVGRGSHPCSWLVPCEALRFLSFPSEGLCFTCKQWQWPQLAWPSTASKLAEPRKEKEVGVRIGWGRRVGLGGGVGMSECLFFQATDVMPVPTVGERRRDQAPLFFSFPLHSLFFQDEWIFQKLWAIVSHNRLRLSQFYAAFPVRGGSLSVGIEDHCDAVKTTRGCRSNTLWPWKQKDEERKRKLKHTRSIQTHEPPLTANKMGCYALKD